MAGYNDKQNYQQDQDEPEYEEDYSQQPYQVTSDEDEDFDPVEDEYGTMPNAPAQESYIPYEDEEYEDEKDSEHRFHVAMNVFDFISVLVGVVVILLMVALLISLFSWLRTDILDSFTLLTQGLQ